MKSPARIAIAVVLALPLTLAAGTALAKATAHSHEVHGTMELNQGQKWQTDAPLRQGMQELHQIVSAGLSDAHANTLQPADFQRMSDEIMTQFTYIVENCKLEPEPDAQLHILLGSIIQGVDVMKGKEPGQEPEAGLVKMAEALNNYGTYFDHPNWKSFDLAH